MRALDQRGHGDSAWVDPPAYAYADYAADINRVVEKLDLRDFVLIGHSMGGMVSLVYTATLSRAREEARRRRYLDQAVRGAAELHARARLARRHRVQEPGRADLTLQAAPDARSRRRKSCTASPATARSSFPTARGGTSSTATSTRSRESIDGLPFWDEVKIPALLVKGDRSERITPEIYAAVKERCPQVELAEVANSDHHITLDNPAGFVAAVKPFLA